MAWIHTIDEREAQDDLKTLYEDYRQSSGLPAVANVLKLFSLSPASFEKHLAYYRQIAYGRGPLRRYQREMIAAYVSQANGCFY